MGIGEAAAALLYRALRALARVAVRVYFRRVDVIRAAPLPAGPLLVAANHPASVTDVVLIALALPRRLHIVARVGLFRPWPRAWVVRALGCLPVVAAGERPDQAETNARTFAAAQALFDAGGALLVFPEGRSESDREVLPLRTGSARLALAVESRAPGRLALLPVGLRLAERTAFRTEVAVHVGAPLPLAPFAAQARADHEGAVRSLTDALHAALAELLPPVPEAQLAGFAHALEPLAREAPGAAPGAPELDAAREVAATLAHLRRRDPDGLGALWRRWRRYQAGLEALGLEDALLGAGAPPSLAGQSARLLLAGALVAAAMLPGALLNLVPWQLTRFVSALVAPEPPRISFARLLTGALAFPLAWAATAWAWLRFAHGSLRVALVLAFAAGPLGLLALACRGWLARERGRLRVARAATTRPALLAALRAERAALLAEVARARDARRAAEAAS